MKFNLLHLGRKVINFSWILFGLRSYKLNLSHLEVEKILKKIENKVYGEKGINKFEDNSNSEIKRLILRSFAQFLSQREIYRSKLGLFIQDILFVFFFLLIIFYISIKMFFVQEKIYHSNTDVVVCYHYPYLKKIVADLFINSNKKRIFIEKLSMYLTLKDIFFFIRCLVYYPRLMLYPHFLFSLLKWICCYSFIVCRYKPRAIVNFFEGSFISSIMTGYLREHNIIHINHMHGERLFQPQLSFCEFDYFYVYGQYWIDLFKHLKCNSNYVIKINSFHKCLYKLRYSKSRNYDKKILIIHSQILTCASKEYKLLTNVLKNVPKDWKIKYRFHPNEKESGIRFFNYLKKEKFSQKLGIDIQLDDFQERSIEKSLHTTKVVIGQISAALLEAWIAGCKVIYLCKTYDLETRYNESRNIFFINFNSNDKEIKKFLLDPPIVNEKENKLIKYVSNVFSKKILII